MYQEMAPIISNHEVMPRVYLIWVESSDMVSEAQPGQFAMISCNSEGAASRRLLRRPLSIHRASGHSLAFLFAETGAGTEWLAKRKPGETIDILGPAGNGFTINPDSRNLLLVAGGIGIAPLCFLAQEAREKELNVKILAGARTACQICPPQLIPSGTDILTVTEDGTAGEKGMVTDLLKEHAGWADQIFICGPLPMFQTIAERFRASLKGKPVQVSLEVRMGCGTGICYACSIKTGKGMKQVCQDGPSSTWKM
jgi:dihydroorotate dehydrogenase electron transfer subunit